MEFWIVAVNLTSPVTTWSDANWKSHTKTLTPFEEIEQQEKEKGNLLNQNTKPKHHPVPI